MPVKTVAPVGKIDRPGGVFRDRDGIHSRHSYVDDHHKYIWLSAGEFMADDNTEHVTDEETIESTLGSMARWILPGDEDIGTWHGVSTTVWRPKKWVNGIIDYTFYFSANDNNEVAISLQIRSKSHTVGDVLSITSPNLLDLTPTTITTTSADNTLQTINVQSDNVLLNTDDLFGILVERDATSQDEIDLAFYGVLLRYLPTNRQ